MRDPELDSKDSMFKVSLGDYETVCGAKKRNALRTLVREPAKFIRLEKAIDAIDRNDWVALKENYVKESFVWYIRQVWRYVKPKLELEKWVVDALLEEGNGGLRVATLLDRLLRKGVICGYAQLRDALSHLCTLYIAEHQGGMFSVRDGLVDFSD
jgi:hypothetical protein